MLLQLQSTVNKNVTRDCFYDELSRCKLSDICEYSQTLALLAQLWRMKIHENGRNFFIFGRSFTSRSQNIDVLNTFCGRKYGRLDVIQNPGRSTTYADSWTFLQTSHTHRPSFVNFAALSSVHDLNGLYLYTLYILQDKDFLEEESYFLEAIRHAPYHVERLSSQAN